LSYLAIDPGLDTGWAYFRSATDLVSCGVTDARELGLSGIGCVIIEKPVIYSARLMKGDPNNIITLALQVGAYREYFQSRGARVALVTPGTWKGQIPKPIHHARVKAALSPANKAILDACVQYLPASKAHNAIDAVALGFEAFAQKLWLTS
jgi:hypothetical protein